MKKAIFCITSVIFGTAIGYAVLTFFGNPFNKEASSESVAQSDIFFLEIPTLVVMISDGVSERNIKLSAVIETSKEHSIAIEELTPRISDVIFGYLSALSVENFQDSNSVTVIRNQLLHRVNIVAGPEKVTDVLISELILI